jgi:flagellar hook-associated protein 1 FlgK
MSLYTTGASGMAAAKAMMKTTEHNLSNAHTVGYHRQRTELSTANGQATSSGFFGRGVNADSVVREFDRFQFTQLLSAQGKQAQLTAQVERLNAVADGFAGSERGIAPALNDYFADINKLASSPDDPAIRVNLIGTGNALANQIRSQYSELQSKRDDLNGEFENAVTLANGLLDRLNNLNREITGMRASSGGQPPNDLLDKRDQSISDLNDIIGIKTSEDALGRTSITLSSGQPLLSGQRVFKLQAVASALDPAKTVIAYTMPDGANSSKAFEVADQDVSGGTIGGLAKFRSESLDVFQNRLGQLAVGLAMQVNAVHRGGRTPAGAPGADIFSITSAKGGSHLNNTGSAAVSANFVDSGKITISDYAIKFDGANYEVSRLSDGVSVGSSIGADLNVDGLNISFSGTAAAGDQWILSPTRDAAENFRQLVQRPNELAAADSAGGTTNGKNAQALADLQTKRFFDDGLSSVMEQFSQTVNVVAMDTAQAQASLASQKAVVDGRREASLGQVNLNAEAISLMEFQNFFQANARSIDAATKAFDAVLGLRS